MIPEDWEVRPLADVATLERGKFSARPRNDPKYYGGTIPFIQTGDVTNSNGDIRSFFQTLNEAGLRVSKLFPRDTLFFTIAANIGDVGFAAFATACPDSLVAITPNSQMDKRWLYHALTSRKKIFEGLATQNAQLNINLEKLRPYRFPIPPLPEQRAIATALSDVDTLLAKLDALIAKKRDLKVAAMQQLLTGQTRLPGFSGEWEVKTIKSLVQTPVTDGPHMTPRFLETGIPFLSVNNLVDNKIDLSDLRFISQQDHDEFSKKCKPRKGDLLLGKAASVGKVAIVDTDVEFNIWSPIALIRIGFENMPRFIYYQLQTASLSRQITLLTNSSSQGNIGMGDIEKLEVQLPPSDEQIAIATVLADMDTELTALEARRDKTRALKQGMMQELLTGKIRLV